MESGECVTILSEHIAHCLCSVGSDGSLLASGSGATLFLWRVDSGECIKSTVAHEGVVASLCSLGDGGLLASASDDLSIRIWHLNSIGSVPPPSEFEEVEICYSVSSLGLDRSRLAIAWGKDVRLWHIDSGECQTLTGHDGTITKICSLGPDSGLFASASHDKTIRIWRVDSGECVKTLIGHDEEINDICSLGPDSGFLASASQDRTVRLWKTSNGECKIFTGHERGVNCVCALGPSSGLLASASIDNMVRIWRIDSGECVHTLSGHESAIYCIRLLWPDCGQLASASIDGTVRVWSLDDGECVHVLKAHSNIAQKILLRAEPADEILLLEPKPNFLVVSGSLPAFIDAPVLCSSPVRSRGASSLPYGVVTAMAANRTIQSFAMIPF